MVRSKSIPAHDGARSDADGFCLAHPDVRLRRPAADGGYETVRKICSKCGVTTSRGLRKTRPRGNGKEAMPRRVASGGPSPAGGGGGRGGGRGSDDGRAKRADHGDGRDPPEGGARRRSRGRDSRAPRRSDPSHGEGVGREFGRTLSRPREGRREAPVRPPSFSQITKKSVTDEKLRELVALMPPLYGPTRGRKGKAMRVGRDLLPFDEGGYCRAHPEVRLAERNSEREWKVVSGVCPRCCADAALACQRNSPSADKEKKDEYNYGDDSRSNDYDSIIGKLLTLTDGEPHPLIAKPRLEAPPLKKRTSGGSAQPTSASSSYPSTPESTPRPAFSTDYFASANCGVVGWASDAREGEEQMGAGLDRPCAPETNAKPKSVDDGRHGTGRGSNLRMEPPGRRP